MRKLLLSFAAICMAFSLSAQSDSKTTSYYLLPEGSFYVGLTSTAALSSPAIYMPFAADSSHVFRSITGVGSWYTGTKGATLAASDTTQYNMKLGIGKYFGWAPTLQCADTLRAYRYGMGTTSACNTYSASGNYALMTGARIWCDTTVVNSAGNKVESGQSHTKWSTWITTVADVDTFFTYFYNFNPMMIKGISLPIIGKSGTVDNLFPNENSHLTVNIYQATATPNGDGTYTRSFSRSKKLVETITLTKANFSVNSSTAYRGAMNYTLDKPILVTGPFVMEVSEFKTCGEFYFYADNYCKNYTSLYAKAGSNKVPSKGNLLFAVSAYFPAAQVLQKETKVPAIVSTAAIKMNTNTKYNEADWNITTPEWVESFTVDTTGGNAKTPTFNFSVKENTAMESRTDTIFFEMLGFKAYALITQNKPQTFIMPVGATKEGVIPSEGGTMKFGDAEELLLLTNISSTDNIQYSFPAWITGKLEILASDTLRITAAAEKNTMADLKDTIYVWGEDADKLAIPVSQDKWFAYVKTGFSETGFSFPGKGGQMKFEHYTNTEMFFQSNVPYTDWQITKPDWITDVVLKDTLRNGVPNVSMILFAAVNMGGTRTDSITITASEESFLKFGLIQDSLIRTPAYYTIDGALYRGFGPKRAVYTTPYIFVPYADSVAVRVDQAGVGTWYTNSKLQDENADTYYVGPLINNVNKYILYMPEFHPNDSLLYLPYQYGGKYYSKSRVRYGSGNKDYLCPASLYADTTEHSSGQGYWQRSGTISGVKYDYSYGSGLGEGSGRYDTIGQFIPLADVLTFDTVYVGMYNAAKQGMETIFGDSGKMTLSVYYAELDADGVPVIDRENPLAVMVSDSNMWQPSATYNYYGTLTFHNLVKNKLGIESVKPVIAEKSIYCEFTGFNESGMNFGFYSDGYTNVAPNAWFTKDGKQVKLWGTQHNIFISLYGFFPMMVDWNEFECSEFEASAEGGTAHVVGNDSIEVYWLRANRPMEEWSIDYPDWVMPMYDDEEFESGNIMGVSFIAEELPEGESSREGDIIIENYGKSVKIHISQAGGTVGINDLYNTSTDNVEKIIRNGHMYIIRGDRMYDAVGLLVE